MNPLLPKTSSLLSLLCLPSILLLSSVDVATAAEKCRNDDEQPLEFRFFTDNNSWADNGWTLECEYEDESKSLLWEVPVGSLKYEARTQVIREAACVPDSATCTLKIYDTAGDGLESYPRLSPDGKKEEAFPGWFALLHGSTTIGTYKNVQDPAFSELTYCVGPKCDQVPQEVPTNGDNCQDIVYLALQLDANPQDTTFQLVCNDGNDIVWDGKDFTEAGTFVEEEACIPKDTCCKFVITDSSANGLSSELDTTQMADGTRAAGFLFLESNFEPVLEYDGVTGEPFDVLTADICSTKVDEIVSAHSNDEYDDNTNADTNINTDNSSSDSTDTTETSSNDAAEDTNEDSDEESTDVYDADDIDTTTDAETEDDISTDEIDTDTDPDQMDMNPNSDSDTDSVYMFDEPATTDTEMMFDTTDENNNMDWDSLYAADEEKWEEWDEYVDWEGKTWQPSTWAPTSEWTSEGTSEGTYESTAWGTYEPTQSFWDDATMDDDFTSQQYWDPEEEEAIKFEQNFGDDIVMNDDDFSEFPPTVPPQPVTPSNNNNNNAHHQFGDSRDEVEEELEKLEHLVEELENDINTDKIKPDDATVAFLSEQEQQENKKGMSKGAVIGTSIVGALILTVVLVLSVFYFFGEKILEKLGENDENDDDDNDDIDETDEKENESQDTASGSEDDVVEIISIHDDTTKKEDEMV